MIAVAQRNMEVRFLQRAPRGSLAFGFASPLVCTFGAPNSEKTSGTWVSEATLFTQLMSTGGQVAAGIQQDFLSNGNLGNPPKPKLIVTGFE